MLGIALGGGGSACLLELSQELACGDGKLDLQAGEECDPAVPDSYLRACQETNRREGVAACDLKTCQIIADVTQCGVCGDGEVDDELGEDCDGDNLDGASCPSGRGQLQCASDCTLDLSRCDPCGNGTVEQELGEECDPGIGVPEDMIVDSTSCTALEPLGEKPYASGTVVDCSDDCVFNRIGCSYCGDGVRDEATSIDGDLMVSAEWCDGDEFDEQRLLEVKGNVCPDPRERPNVACAESCKGFIDRAGDGCCIKKGETCPLDNEPTKCCYAYAHPGEDPCEVFTSGGEVRVLCK